MGLRQRNKITESTLFFVTTSILNHKKLFNPENIKKAEEILFRTAKDKDVILMGYVIMPNHIHLLVGAYEGGSQLSKFMHSLKGRIRKDLFGDQKIWQNRFDDLVIIGEKQFRIKLEYIHGNPVRAGLSVTQIGWFGSSALAWENRESEFICFDFNWQE